VNSRNAFELAAFLVLAITALGASTPTMPSFYARRDYHGEPRNCQTQVAGVNNDGIPDLVVDGAYVMLGNGDGTFKPGIVSNSVLFTIESFALADVNGDGVLDLVTSGAIYTGQFTSGIGVSLGNGDGTFQTGTFYPVDVGDGLNGVVVGDYNGDGILAIAAIGDGALWLFTAQGGGVFNQAVKTPLYGQPLTIVSADLNGGQEA
jgi:hypothetical protein